jgi:hypothetical protein
MRHAPRSSTYRDEGQVYGGAGTLLVVLLLTLVPAAVAGAMVARWADSALEVSNPDQLSDLLTRHKPERFLVGAVAASDTAPECASGEMSDKTLFAELRLAIGDTFGRPLECPHIDPSTGDTLQRTSTGLAIYRVRSATPTFTDGYHRWALAQSGLVTWQGEALDPPE